MSDSLNFSLGSLGALCKISDVDIFKRYTASISKCHTERQGPWPLQFKFYLMPQFLGSPMGKKTSDLDGICRNMHMNM